MFNVVLAWVAQKPSALWFYREYYIVFGFPAGPSHLFMHILSLGCGCVDLLGYRYCKHLGVSENVLVGFCLHLCPLTCYLQPPSTTIYMNSRDPQTPLERILSMVGLQTLVEWRNVLLFSCLELGSEFKHCPLFLWKHFLLERVCISELVFVCCILFKCSLWSLKEWLYWCDFSVPWSYDYITVWKDQLNSASPKWNVNFHLAGNNCHQNRKNLRNISNSSPL